MTSHKRPMAFLNILRSFRPQCMSHRKRVARSIKTIVHPWDSSGAIFLWTRVYSSSPSHDLESLLHCCQRLTGFTEAFTFPESVHLGGRARAETLPTVTAP